MSRPSSLVLCAILALAGCAEQPGPKTVGGALIGGAAGGLVGSQLGGGGGKAAMTGLGVLLGALAGSEVGKSLDRADQLALERTTQQALETVPSGQASPWRNPDSGHYGSVTPVRTMQQPDGRYCREFQQTVTIGGRSQQAFGTACREPDGTWRILG